jgi:hypothetical protein
MTKTSTGQTGQAGQFGLTAFWEDVWLVDGVRTPFVDYTGVRLAVTVARELQRSETRYGIASACIGGDQGIALLVENPKAA